LFDEAVDRYEGAVVVIGIGHVLVASEPTQQQPHLGARRCRAQPLQLAPMRLFHYGNDIELVEIIGAHLARPQIADIDAEFAGGDDGAAVGSFALMKAVYSRRIHLYARLQTGGAQTVAKNAVGGG